MTTATFKQSQFDVLTTGLKYSAVFVPQSRSRNKAEKTLSLNWTIVISNDRASIECDYQQGIGCLSDNDSKRLDRLVGPKRYGRTSVDRAAAEKDIVQQGRLLEKSIDAPLFRDVMFSLVSDAESIDHGSFESWASDYGYDTDSRTAEKTYRTCLETGLKLRAMLGDDVLNQLRELFQNY